MVGKRHALVEKALGELGQEVGRAGEEDGRRLARYAAEGENEACYDARHGHGEDYVPDGLRFRCPQGQGALAVGVGDVLQGLLRGADDDGQGQQSQRERAGEDAVAEAQIIDEEGHSEQTEDDGGDARQVVRHHAYEAHEFALAGVFVHVDAAHDAYGEGEAGAARHEAEGAHDGGQDAAGGHAVRGRKGEEVPAEHAETLDDDEAQYAQERQGHGPAQQAEEEENGLFYSKKLRYKAKKERTASKRQKEYLQDLIKYHRINVTVQMEHMSGNEISRMTDKIIFTYESFNSWCHFIPPYWCSNKYNIITRDINIGLISGLIPLSCCSFAIPYAVS